MKDLFNKIRKKAVENIKLEDLVVEDGIVKVKKRPENMETKEIIIEEEIFEDIDYGIPKLTKEMVKKIEKEIILDAARCREDWIDIVDIWEVNSKILVFIRVKNLDNKIYHTVMYKDFENIWIPTSGLNHSSAIRGFNQSLYKGEFLEEFVVGTSKKIDLFDLPKMMADSYSMLKEINFNNFSFTELSNYIKEIMQEDIEYLKPSFRIDKYPRGWEIKVVNHTIRTFLDRDVIRDIEIEWEMEMNNDESNWEARRNEYYEDNEW